MKKWLVILAVLMFGTGLTCIAEETPVMEDVQLETRGYDLVEVPAGPSYLSPVHRKFQQNTVPKGSK